MKIAVFYPDSPNAVWSLSKGICTTLKTMGHEAVEEPQHAEAIIVSGPEYLWRKLRLRFPQWDKFTAYKCGWLHETVEREDYGSHYIATDGKLPVQNLKEFLDVIYTPAKQDSVYGFKYLPFGVDTEVFQPSAVKDGKVLFVGSLYEKRRNFLKKYPEVSLRNHKDFLVYKCGASIDEYVHLTANASAVLNLPTLSRLNSTRVYEAMACKALTITPLMGGSDANYSMFEDKKHLLYYTDSPNEALRHIEVHHTNTNEWHYELSVEGKSIAEVGYQEVIKNHTLKQRLEKLLHVV